MQQNPIRQRIALIVGVCLAFLSMAIAVPAWCGDDSDLAEMSEQERLLDDPDLFADKTWPGEEEEIIADPFEPLNRFFFVVNDRLYFWLLKPVATAYARVLPEDVRGCVRNGFENLQAPVRAVNSLLQGKAKASSIVLARFLINSTIGAAGLGDPAKTEFGLNPEEEDFGQTLGVYGVGEGVYICWPMMGPSSIRDSFGLMLDSFLNLTTFAVAKNPPAAFAVYGGQRINYTSLSLQDYDQFKKFAFDPYVAMREAYAQYRLNLVQDKAMQGSSLFSESTDAGSIPASSVK